ncbi:MAG: ShlB/FhaC/HecB family hemolysin secretion/activation protein [Sphingomonas sp.]|uniref:ShlB/FhaC/HecB family hemolysin secretion/activation protein n=1 Tax=Sphingomonas sp. TaxID=28214 RepID=UPI0035631391
MRRLCGAAGIIAAVNLVHGSSAWAQQATGEKPAVQADAGAAPAADDGQPQRLIDIMNYRIEGNSVLDRRSVERAVLPYLGPQRSTGDVELARAALEKAYRDAGYETVAVEIPEQEVRKGIVRLNVTELRVGRLRVTNARWYSPEDIKDRAPSLAEGSVPNYKAVAQEIAALNKSQERTITPALRAGDTPGTVDVDLDVDDRMPFHGSLEINDRTSARTKRLRASASVRYANLFQRDHSLSLQGQFAPEDPGQSWVVSGSYVAPIAGTPFTLVAYGVHSNSDVAAIGGINVLGSGDIAGIRGIYNFQSSDTLFHTITLGADYKSFGENLLLGDNTAKTPIDYIPLTLQYALAQRTKNTDLDFNVSLNFGLRGLDADDIEFQLKRSGASASYAYLRADFDYLWRLPHDFRFNLKLAGQISGQPLISNEQFGAGGLDSVRGYYESQELGDDGYSFQVDAISPSLLGDTKGRHELRLFAFVDGALVRVNEPLDPSTASASLMSVGGGINARFFNRFNASGLLAVPLRRRSTTLIDFNNNVRAQFRVWADF